MTPFICLILLFNLGFRVSANEEVDALFELKRSLVDPTGVLENWDNSLVNPCTWFHVSCDSEDRVTRVDLADANLSGQLVPGLGRLLNLQYLGLYNNQISGSIPDDFGDMKELTSLDLYLNKLNGPIPSTLSKLEKLRFMRLNGNNLSGEIPRSLTALPSLIVLDFSDNHLTGDIPVNGSFSSLTSISFKNNSLNPLQVVPTTPLPLPPPSGKAEARVIAGGVAAGAAVLFSVPVLLLILRQRRRQADPFYDIPAEEYQQEFHLEQLKKFSLRELQVATDNFSNKNIIGRGGFGNVYKGRLANGSLVAIKKLKEECTQGGEMQFQTEVEIISLAVHRNLLRLSGFCMTLTERVLVYPLMINRSVASYLRERLESQPVLDWPKRKHIALGAARGLAYLHDHCSPKIIHRDVKAANILLDENFEAVVGDFGLARLLDYKDSHVTTAVRGTIGHIAPEYLSTGQASDKVDVFGYGIMLLELITGERASDLARRANEIDVMLFEWIDRLLKENKWERLVHSDMKDSYVAEEVEKLIQMALLCTQSSPWHRPKMSEVVRMLESGEMSDRWEEWERAAVFRRDINGSDNSNTAWNIIGDSTYCLSNDTLSAPR